MHHQLARRLELSEAKNAGELALVWAQGHPGQGDAVLEIAGGTAAYGGVVSPLSHAVGLGMLGSISDAELEQVEQFILHAARRPLSTFVR